MSPPVPKKRVIIVGAGPCGLVALKEMRAAGHDAHAFERAPHLGGVFAGAGAGAGAAYPNLHLTISNWAMAFSDFPDPRRLCYPSAGEYLDYLRAYARRFGLEDHVSCSSEVEDARLGPSGRWELRVRQAGGGGAPAGGLVVNNNNNNDNNRPPGQEDEEAEKEKLLCLSADALVVATGANQVAKEVPEGLSGFEGRVLHSKDYSEAFKREVAEGKLRVLVVGGGESAADIAAELGDLSSSSPSSSTAPARHRSKVTAWLRRAVCVGPRYLNNEPSEMAQVARNKTADFPANGFLEAATTGRMGAGHQNALAYGALRRLLWALGGAVLHPALSRMSLRATRRAPLAGDQATYVTKNQRMCEALHRGTIEVLVSPSVTARGTSCRFSPVTGGGEGGGGSEERREFDAVVLCHGYRTAFPWLRVPPPPGPASSDLTTTTMTTNPRRWFLNCFPPGLGHCLFFVGHARPHQGGIPAAAEMLARYAALVLRGERTLPRGYARLARRDEAAARAYYHLSPDLHALVDYNAFLEGVARRVGCEPRLPAACVAVFNLNVAATLLLAAHLVSQLPLPPPPSPLGFGLGLGPAKLTMTLVLVSLWSATLAFMLRYQDGLLIKWWFYPHWGVWYRQRGPGADPALLGRVLGRVPLREATAVTRGFVLLVLWSVPAMYAQRVLSVPVFLLHQGLVARGLRPRHDGGGGGGEEEEEEVAVGGYWDAMLRPKTFALHSCEWRWSDLFVP